jgi:hypothetical protein
VLRKCTDVWEGFGSVRLSGHILLRSD